MATDRSVSQKVPLTVLFATLYIQIVVGSLLFFTSLIMIFLILIQRGRGGGLAGALGGSGGSSAFGAKAGDTFTRVTAGMAIFWFVLCLFAILLIQGPRATTRPEGDSGSGAVAPTGATPAPAEGETPALPPIDLSKTLPPTPADNSSDAEKAAVPPADTATPPADTATPPADTAAPSGGSTAPPTDATSPTGTPPANDPVEAPKTDGSLP
jgi:preprotein translocase subunit SecG